MNIITFRAYAEELEKVAGPFSPYERKRRSAKTDVALSSAEREAMMQSYLKDRGDDKYRSARVAGAGSFLGSIGGAAALGSEAARTNYLDGAAARSKGIKKALLTGALAGGALAGGLGAGISEVRRHQAASAAKDPEQTKALLSRSVFRHQLQNIVLRNREAALRGEKPSRGLFHTRAAPRGDGKV